jgi:hypothetical protein
LRPAEVSPEEFTGVEQLDDAIDIEFAHDMSVTRNAVEDASIRGIHKMYEEG